MDFKRQYDERLMDIIANGVSNEGKEVRTVWKDGEPAYTKAVWVRQFRVRPEDPFPLLYKKFVNPKSFTSEILWIMQKASNVVQDARDLGTKVWDEWENEEGTIGKAYGYQIRNNRFVVEVDKVSEKARKAMGRDIVKYGEGKKGDYLQQFEDGKVVVKLTQIDYVIHQLIDNPYSRQTMTTIYNPKEHHEMELPPCVWTSHWEVMADGKLYLAVTARSSDTFLGLPFNVAQYSLLHRLIAHVTGYEIGDFVLTTDDSHLYDRHIPIALEYLEREEPEIDVEFWIDEEVESFRDFEYEINFGWKGYSKEEVKPLAAPIAIGLRELERLREEEKQKK